MAHQQFDLNDRLIDFAVAISDVVRNLPGNRVGSHIAGQLVRCGTAPAAHHAEAQSAESRRDFTHKMKLALKELRESLVWLRLAQRMDLAGDGALQAAERECNELTPIFVKSIDTAVSNRRTLNEER